MEIDVNDYLAAVVAQRNSLLDDIAKLQAYIAKLERKAAEAPVISE